MLVSSGDSPAFPGGVYLCEPKNEEQELVTNTPQNHPETSKVFLHGRVFEQMIPAKRVGPVKGSIPGWIQMDLQD